MTVYEQFEGNVCVSKVPQEFQNCFLAAFEKTAKQFENIDILINNAGILNDAVWEKEILINIVSKIFFWNCYPNVVNIDKNSWKIITTALKWI